MSASGSSRPPKLLVVGLILVGGIILSLVAHSLSARNARRLRHAALVQQADLQIHALDDRLRRATNASLPPIPRSHSETRDRRTMFRDLADVRLSSNDDIKAIMWIPRVPREDLAAHKQAARDEGLTKYHVHGHSNENAEQADELFPVFCIEPRSSNATTLGLDLATLPQMRDSMEHALKNGGVSITQPLLWRDDSGEILAIVAFRAWTRSRRADDASNAQQEQLVGYTATVVAIGKIMEDVFSHYQPKMDIALFGEINGGPSQPLCRYDSQTGHVLPAGSGNLFRFDESSMTPPRQVNVPGCRWSARGVPRADFQGRYRTVSSYVILLVGLAFTAMVAACANSALGRAAQIRELAAAKAAAEAANRAKSDFVAHMSHEIRTPINAVIGITESVLGTDLTDSQRQYLKIALESSESLLAVINDVLDFSRIEAGKLDLDFTTFELRELVGDTMKSLAFRAHDKGLELACRIAPDVPDRLVGDRGRLRQVIVNLVGNAVKFTDLGEVVLELAGEPCSQNRVRLHVNVRDTGVGIAPEDQPKIFNAFEQVDSSSTQRFNGSGLGLSICRRLVQMMDGKLWVESTPGRGSRFHFTACFHLAPGHEHDSANTSLTGTPILVVDDNATNRTILAEMLSDWGMVPTCASGAAEAVDLACEAFQNGRPFPLVLADADMPGVNGFELAQLIHDNADLRIGVVMMLASHAPPVEGPRGENLDIAARLLKPLKPSELFDTLVMSLDARKAKYKPARTDRGETPISLPPLRILLAEDSLVNQKLAVGLLKKHGHQVVVANDGRETIAAFDSQEFDVVLMDVQMPEIDGFEATAAIRAKQKAGTRRTPVIAMTAYAQKGDRERCLEAGMDGYVAKPIRVAPLFQLIADILDSQARGPTATG